MIYLDNNSTTQLDDVVLETMMPFLTKEYGNPGSPHSWGYRAKEAVETARVQIANFIDAEPEEIIFTGSATEANNLALKGYFANEKKLCRVIANRIEHKSVLEPLEFLEQQGKIVLSRLDPDSFGQITPEKLAHILDSETKMVCVMAAHNVLHTINPIKELVLLCSHNDIIFHCDATQFVGKIPFSVKSWGIDTLTLSAHKLYGPKGVGALYISPAAKTKIKTPLLHGGGQERGLRAGTLNVAGIVGFGAACIRAAKLLQEESERIKKLGNLFFSRLSSQVEDICLNGHPVERIPGGLCLACPSIEVNGLLGAIPELAFSSGAACETDQDPGFIYKVINKPEFAHCSFRIQIGRFTTEDEIFQAVELLVKGIHQVRKFYK